MPNEETEKNKMESIVNFRIEEYNFCNKEIFMNELNGWIDITEEREMNFVTNQWKLSKIKNRKS